MKLIIDQGNTRIKIAIFNGKKFIEKNIFDYKHLDDLERYIDRISPKAIIVSSVVEEVISTQNIKTVHFTSRTPIPIKNNYQTPNSLGLDRLANAIGAWSINPNKNNLIIDLGTCVKYDIIDSNNSYLGGNISPGLEMRYRALHDYTAKLPLLTSKNFLEQFGTDTTSSIQNGVEQGLYHEINGFIERYSEEFEGLTIFMTGGTSKFFDKEYKNGIFANPNLTMIGLNEILDYNAE